MKITNLLESGVKDWHLAVPALSPRTSAHFELYRGVIKVCGSKMCRMRSMRNRVLNVIVGL